MTLAYLNFDLEIGPPTGQSYPVTVLYSPAGDARATMQWNLGELALENRLKDLQIALLSSGGVRRMRIASIFQSLSTPTNMYRDFSFITGDSPPC